LTETPENLCKETKTKINSYAVYYPFKFSLLYLIEKDFLSSQECGQTLYLNTLNGTDVSGESEREFFKMFHR